MSDTLSGHTDTPQ